MRKQIMKRALSFLLALVMVFSMLPSEALASETDPHEGHDHTVEETVPTDSETPESESSETISEPDAPEGWTEEMVEIQTMIDEILDYYLVYYGFEIPDMEYKAEEDMTEEEIQAWEDIHAQIEDIVLNKMDANERENAVGDLNAFNYELEQYALTEDVREALMVANPVYVDFEGLVYAHGTSLEFFATVEPIAGISITDNKNKLTLTNGVVTAKAKGSGWLSSKQETNELTITNTSSNTAIITFDYAASNFDGLVGWGININTYTEKINGSCSETLAAGESVKLSLKSRGKSSNGDAILNLSNITIHEVTGSSNVTFIYDSELGSITIGGESVSNGDAVEVPAAGAELVATSIGSTFLGWVDAATGAILSTATTYKHVPVENMTIKAIFAKDGGNAVFAVGSTTSHTYAENVEALGFVIVHGTSFAYKKVTVTHLFDNLGDAITSANSSGSKVIIPMNNGTITGNYTIPNGVTLLIPYDAAGTLSTTAPICKGLVGVPASLDAIKAYRTLTMASGSSITVASGGAINVNAELFAVGGSDIGGGSPLNGYGYIKMQNNSNIIIQSGGNLYCYGYIGGTGIVTAQSGSTVYEVFALEDFRGGSVTSSNAQDTTRGIFPMNCYAVQNVMVPLTLESGATEYAYASLHMSSATFGTAIKFIGPQGSGSTDSAMFTMKSGSVTKDYEESTDRMVITAHSSVVSVSNIKMQISDISLESKYFDLPINGKITLIIGAGSTIELSQDVTLMPGAEVYINKGAVCDLKSGCNLFVFDMDQWPTVEGTGYVGSLRRGMNATYFVPERQTTRTVADLKDVYFQVAGEVVVSGNVYTTGTLDDPATPDVNEASGGAAIAGVEGAKVTLKKGDPENANHYELVQDQTEYANCTKVDVDLTDARLMNADGSYTDPSKINPELGLVYTYTNGVWVADCPGDDTCTYNVETATCATPKHCIYCDVTPIVVEHTLGTAATCTTGEICSVCGQEYSDPLGHDEKTIAAVAATCYATGLTEGKVCQREGCGVITVEQTVTEKIDHDWYFSSEIDAPTCTMVGHNEYTCKVTECGVTKTEDVPALGHDLKLTTGRAATCTNPGVKDYYQCQRCGGFFEDSEGKTQIIETIDTWKVIPATGHSANKTPEVDSTCTTFGTKAYWYCANCKLYYSDEVCTKLIGNDTDLATWKNGDGQIVKKAHQMIDVQEVAATCLAPGAEAGTRCSVCGTIESGCATIPQLTHKAALPLSKAPDCDDAGYKAHYWCGNGCKQYYADENCTIVIGDAAALDTWKAEGGAGYLKATGHTEVDIPEVPATCTTAGSTAGVKCSVCDTVITAPQPIAAAHTPGEAVIENMDTTTGIHELVVYCTVETCKEEISRKTIIPGQSTEHTLKTLVRVEPTCYSTGWSAGAICEVGLEGSCPACVADGKTYKMEQEVLEMLPHTVNPGAITLKWDGYTSCTATATCVNAGCDATVTETVVVAKTDRVEATCTAPGSVTYTTSAFINEAFIKADLAAQTAQEQLPQLTHQWGEASYQWSEDYATCTATRNCIYGCTDTEKSADISVVVTAPTCTEAGYTTYKATFKYTWHTEENKIQTAVISGDPAKGHTWNVTATEWNSDNTQCTASLHCDCGATNSAVSISVSKSETPATCTAAGSVVYTAVFADEYKIAAQNKTVTIAMLGHDWTGAVVTYTWAEDHSSCTAVRSCQRECGHSETETVEATKIGSTATCIAAGKNTHQSGAFTNEAFAQQTTHVDQAALGHDMTYVEAKDATCTEDGNNAYYTCKRCKNAFKDEAGNTSTTPAAETIYSSGHEYSAVVTAPTCSSQGYTTHTCGKCNDVVVDTEVDPRYERGYHSYNEGIVTTDPTCTEDGIKTYTCSACGVDTVNHSYTEPVAMLGHTTVVDEAVAPTCTATGLTVGSHCSRCNDVLVEQETIPALDHDYKVEVTAPTFDAQGYTTYTCSRGDHTYVDNYVPALVAVAKIGDQRYETLEEAITKAVSGDTIVLLVGGEYTAPVIVNEGVTLDLNGQTIKADLIGTLWMNGGTWITGEGYEMVGPYADYYQTTGNDVKIIMGMPNTATGQADITLVSGTLTLVPDEWWTLTGQTLTIGDGATFVIPEGKTLQVLSKVVVVGSATVDGKVNLYTADATVTAENENLNITTTAGDCVLYVNGMYIVHTHTPADAVVENNVDPTCTATGSYDSVIYCSNQNCKVQLSREEVIVDALGHTKATDAAVAPTCTETGLTEGSHCSVCDDVLVKQEFIPALGHKDENKDHVCENGCGIPQGEHSDVDTDQDHLCDYGCQQQIGDHVYTDGVCNCGYVQDLKVSLVITAENALDQNIPQADIKYGTEYSVTLNFSEFGTCYILQDVDVTTGGKKLSVEEYTYNSVTKELYIDKAYVTGDIDIVVIAQQRHEIGESKWEYKAPTCDKPGEMGYIIYCAKCSNVYHKQTTEIAATGHSYYSIYTEPTFTADGYYTYTCATCKDSYTEIAEGTKLTAVAQIGNKQFESLEEAIEAAKNGDVIILLTKVTVDGTAQWDLNGITLRIDDNDNANYGLVVSGDLTINGGNFVATGIYGIGVQPGAKLTINGGNFSVNDNDYLIGSWGTTVINGGTFKGQYSCVNAFGGSVTITGGVFSTEDKDWTGGYDSSDIFGEAVSITGGTFSKTVEDYLADGYCQKAESGKYIVKAHIGGETVIENVIDASCVIDGSHDEVKYCTHCGNVVIRETVVDKAPGHTEVIDEAVAATCINSGLTEGKHCSVCDEVLVAQTGVAPLGHTYDEGVVTTAPTCTEEGVMTYTCTVCTEGTEGHTKTESVDPINHAWSVTYAWSEDHKTCTATHVCANDAAHNESETVEVTALQTKAPTCTDKGETTYTATFTAQWAVTQVEILADVDALDHAWSVTYSWSADHKTCTATHVCGNDAAHNETETETVVAEQTKAPTCTEKGETTYTATFTVEWAEKQVEILEDVPANGHNMREIKGTEATCVTVGNNTYYVCGRCSGVFKDVDGKTATTAAAEIIPAKGHTYNDVVTEPTCTAQGYTTHTCTVCAEGTVGHSYVDSHVDALGHSYDGGVVTIDPTCTVDGVRTFTCITVGCGYSYTEAVDALGHTEVVDAYQAPTCTATGLTAGTHCSVCNEVVVAQQVIDAKGHTTVVDAAVAPTCTATGLTEGSHCSACNEVFVAQDVVAAKGHTDGEVKIENVVAPQCEVDGSHDEVTYCTVCTAETSRVTVADPQTGHTEKTLSAKDADCTNTGLTEGKQCTVCGTHTVPQTVIPANGHSSVVDAAVEATCTATGLTEGEHCSVCDVVLKAQTVVPKKSHSHKVIVSTTLATCTVDGNQVLKCETCDDTITEILKAPGHNSNDTLAAVAPTCTATGLTEGKKCSVCGTVTVEQEIVPAVGHNTITTIQKVDPTCTVDGVKEHYFCDDCDKYFATKTVEGDAVTLSDEITNMAAWKLGDGKINKLGHTNEILPAVAPTCTEDGLKPGIKCSVCGNILVAQEVDPAKGHNDVIDKAVAPTCTATGLTEGKHCSVCTEVLVAQNVVDALGHTEETFEAVPSTCTATGLTEGKHCSVCDVWTVPQTKTPAKGHTEKDIPRLPATCTNTGLTAGKYCTVCQIYTVPQDTIPAKGHTDAIDGKVDPTCTETGLTEGKHCSVCGEVLVAQEVVDAKGHTAAPVAGQAPKCEQAGWKDYYQCKTCKLYFEDEECTKAIADLNAWKTTGAGKIDELGHSWDEGRVTTLPTCTVAGVITYTCGNCNGTKTGEEPALGHALTYHERQNATFHSSGWEAYETCSQCEYTTYVQIPALGEPEVDSFQEFMENLQILEQIANEYVKANPGKDPLGLMIKYIRTGVERYNSGSWGIMAGYEDTDFASYVQKIEDEYNRNVETEAEMLAVTGLKNLKNFTLPNGEKADIGHVFGMMDITYHNNFGLNHMDVGGWIGDTVDLLSLADQFGVSGTIEQMVKDLTNNYLLKHESTFPEKPIEGSFSQMDMDGDLDGYYIMHQLSGVEYENGMLVELLEGYFTETLDAEQRAAYLLKNRLGGVTLRSEVRKAVYNAYTGNKMTKTLEDTREFNSTDLENLRIACCYAVADYLCRLAGDYVEAPSRSYFEVFSSESSVLAPGITQEIKYATSADGKQMVYYIATADITRDDVHLFANYHNNDPAGGWEMQRVLDQANAAQDKYGDPESEYYIENYNVIASTNGSGYNMQTGEPGGVLVMGGVEYHPIDGNGFFGVLKNGKAVIGTTEEYNTIYKGQVQEAIAGFGALLVKDGKIVVGHTEGYTSDRASRTAAGITSTGKVVLMVLDGRQEPFSCGGSMQEIAQIMLEAGCVHAINLDGGGSTTYVARPEGESELKVVSRPSDGSARSVSTSWMMVSTAPNSTAFDHALVKANTKYMTPGSSQQIVAEGVSGSGGEAEIPEGTSWAVADETVGTITAEGQFTALKYGETEIYLMLGDQIIGSMTMKIVVPDNVYFTKNKLDVIYGKAVEMPVKVLYEGKEVTATAADVVFSVAHAGAGTFDGLYFTADEASGVRATTITVALAVDESVSANMPVALFSQGEASFDFENATGGDRQLAWDREVSNATTEDGMTYYIEDVNEDMVTTYSFAIDMTQIPIPPQLDDLIYMLPGADMEGASAWSFLMQLAQRISVMTEVRATVQIDPNFDVDPSEVKLVNDYFEMSRAELDESTNTLVLALKWKKQTQAIDPNIANPMCILSGVKLTPKADAAWKADLLSVVNSGNISYDIYLRASSLYTFAQKPENQELYGLMPYVNPDDSSDAGAGFGDTYKVFVDSYTLVKNTKNGWITEDGGFAYYVNGMKYTGVHEIDGIYYDFGENGLNVGKAPYTGVFLDAEAGVYRCAKNGTLLTGWIMIGEDWYYYAENGDAASGKYTINGLEYTFEETGRLTTGVWVHKAEGSMYSYGPGYHVKGWKEIEGKTYYFRDYYCYKNRHPVNEVSGNSQHWYDFDENGALIEKLDYTGLLMWEGNLYYLVDGVSQYGLHYVDGHYYYFKTGYTAVTGSYYVYETNGLMKAATRKFDENYRMVQGFVEENGETYYYLNGVKDYAGLVFVDGYYYYVNSSYKRVTGKYYVTKTNGLMPAANYQFDDQGRMIISGKNGLSQEADGLYYYVNGQTTYAGLIYVDGYYYYIESNGKAVAGNHNVTKTNGLMEAGYYDFDEQCRLIIKPDVPDTPDEPGTVKNGFVKENGGIYYYVNGKLTYAGLIKVGGYYYYVRGTGEAVSNCRYYVTVNNGLLPSEYYEFDAEGRMINPPVEPDKPDTPDVPDTPDTPDTPDEPGTVKNGFVKENGKIYYYVNGKLTYAGLIKVGGYYYYVRGTCEAVSNCRYYVTVNNGLLPSGYYDFDAEGRMINPPVEPGEPDTPDVPDVPEVPDTPDEPENVKNGFVKESGKIYYYVNGKLTYAGLIKVGGYYYYVRGTCEAVSNCRYYVTVNNGLLPSGYYDFDAEGRMINPPVEPGEPDTPDVPDVPEVPDTPDEPENVKNGFVKENGKIYYYVNGKLTYAGLIKVGGYYYYVRGTCEAVSNCRYYVTVNNGLLPSGYYDFDAEGRMINPPVEPGEPDTPDTPDVPDTPDEPGTVKNGFVKENGKIYYYVNGKLTYVGLIKVGGYYYYVRGTCEAVSNCRYYVTVNNGLLPSTYYNFDAEGRLILE